MGATTPRASPRIEHMRQGTASRHGTAEVHTGRKGAKDDVMAVARGDEWAKASGGFPGSQALAPLVLFGCAMITLPHM